MIKKVGRVVLVGTSHVAKQSREEIKKAIETFEPEVLTLELDYGRLKRLLSNKKDKQKTNYFEAIRQIGVSGFLFGLLASQVQKKVGNSMGIEPGVDMKSAYTLARNNRIPTALIDLDINITLKKLSKLSFTKKIKLFGSLFFKTIKKEHRERLNFDVKKVPPDHVVKEIIEILRKEVPDLYNILIHDRNDHMTKRLIDLMNRHSGNIVAVVGAGHVDGMAKILEKKLYGNMNTFSISFVAQIDDNLELSD